MNSSNVLETIDPISGRNNADRYYRTNEISGYVQDKWQALPNLSITAGVRYDYHGGMTEKYGNMFNFDPRVYSVTGDTTNGFSVEQRRLCHCRQQQVQPHSRGKRLDPDRAPVGHLAARRLCLVAHRITTARSSSAAARACTTTAANSSATSRSRPAAATAVPSA